jgi:hypothetical protein
LEAHKIGTMENSYTVPFYSLASREGGIIEAGTIEEGTIEGGAMKAVIMKAVTMKTVATEVARKS